MPRRRSTNHRFKSNDDNLLKLWNLAANQVCCYLVLLTSPFKLPFNQPQPPIKMPAQQHYLKPSHKRNISISTDSSTDDSTLVSSYTYNDQLPLGSHYYNGNTQPSSHGQYYQDRRRRSIWQSCIPYLVVVIFYIAIFVTLIYIHGLTKKRAWQHWWYGDPRGVSPWFISGRLTKSLLQRTMRRNGGLIREVLLHIAGRGSVPLGSRWFISPSVMLNLIDGFDC